MQLGRALQEALASGEGEFREKVAEMYDRHREMVGDLFKKWHNPTEADFLGAEDEAIRQQGELDAAFGRGVTTAPAATERFVDEVREETKAHEREQQEQEDARQRREREAVDDVGEKPGNEDKGKDEAHRERVETYADEKETEVENAPGATRDEAFSNGFCVLVQAEGFQDVRAGMVDVGRISLSRDVPQFKVGADSKTGVVHPLRGLYRPDHDPIRVWQRADGSLEVISGRHRLAYARESGATRIFCYVYSETPERDARWAKTFDLEQNIRDNQATPLEVALYVRGENAYGRPLSNDEIRDAGIDRTGSRGEAGVQLGRYADDEVITALRNGFPVEDALRVVQFCPGDRDVQREGLRVMRGEPDETGAYNNPGSITEARNVMRRFLEVKRAQKDAAAAGEQGDLFGGLGYGTSLRDAEFNRFLGKYETRRQKEISAERSFLNNLVGKKVSKAMAEKYGIDLNDVEGSLKKKLETLSELYTKWKSPELHPELMEEVRGKFNEVYGGKEELPAASMGGPEAHFSLDPAEWWQKLVRARAVDKSNRVIDKDTFITTPSGNIDWYHFSEDEKTQASLKKAGLKNIPIRLKIGKQFSKRHNGYGYLHILSHLEDFGESPLLFLYKTLSNICRVMPDPKDGNKSLLFAKDGNEASRLVIQLYEEDGCYSIVSCYPLGKANLIEQNQGLPVGRAVLQPISDSEISPIKNRKARNAAEPTGSAMGEVLGDRLPQKRGVVNIYDVRIVDLAGNVIHEQQFEPRARFSLGGEKSAVFGEYEAQGLTYVDPADGKRKFCIDTTGVRLSRGFAMGELSSIAPGGHKDTSLKSLVHYPELWRAYPQLGDMRGRLLTRRGRRRWFCGRSRAAGARTREGISCTLRCGRCCMGACITWQRMRGV